MNITDILQRIEETDYTRVDRCIVYSDLVIFLEDFIKNVRFQETGNKLKDAIISSIMGEIKKQCNENIDEIKNFIALNLIK